MPACNQKLAKSKQKASLRGLRLQRHRQSLANRGVADSKGRSVQEALRGRQKKGRESWRGANCSKCCRFFGRAVTQCRRSLHDAARCVAWFFFRKHVAFLCMAGQVDNFYLRHGVDPQSLPARWATSTSPFSISERVCLSSAWQVNRNYMDSGRCH